MFNIIRPLHIICGERGGMGIDEIERDLGYQWNLIGFFFAGMTGQKQMFTSNHFEMRAGIKWCLCKHHVDFNPPEDRTHIRKMLMRIHKDKFSGYLFDGSTLFTIRNACPDVSCRSQNVMKLTKRYFLTAFICFSFSRGNLWS